MALAFRIDMNAANEQPPGASTSTATGLGVAVLTGAGAASRLEYTINVRGLDWGAFVGQSAQTASTTDNVIDAHFHQAPSNANGPVRFGWRTHDVNDGDAVDDEFTATGLALSGGVPIATVHGVWENTDGAAIVPFLGSFNNPALALGGQTDFYANIHSSAFPGGAIRGQLTLLSTDAGEVVNGVVGTRNDILPGLGGNDIINGFAGNDTIDGGTGADRMNGGLGNDTYTVDNVGDLVTEAVSQGTDTIRSTITRTLPVNVENLTLLGAAVINGTGNTLTNVITGNAARNILLGGAGNDLLEGLGGNDTLDGGAGNDRMIGGLGNDTYTVNSTGDVVTELANQGTDTLRSTITKTLPVNVENLVLLGTGSLSGTGNALANIIFGTSGNNIINGLGGIDRMIGGLGNDIYFVDHISDLVTELANQGTDTLRSTITKTLPVNVENLVLLGTGSLSGTGNALANIIFGTSGNNIINGLGGIDRMIGGLGNDIYFVDHISDLVTEGANAGTDTIRSTVNEALAVNVENLTLLGSANISGTGNALANIIFGTSGNNIINGLGGIDRMIGGLGNDIYFVDHISDRVTEGANAGTDTIRTGVGLTLPSNVENLVLLEGNNINGTGNNLANAITGNALANVINGVAGADILTGAAQNDALNGGADNDLLNGGDGDDHLIGGTGADTMIGGAGNDRLTADGSGDRLAGGTGLDLFEFSSSGLAAGQTVLDYSGIDDGMGTGQDDKIVFIGFNNGRFIDNGAFQAVGRFEVRWSGGSLELDTNGDGNLDFSIDMVGAPLGALLESDFFFV